MSAQVVAVRTSRLWWCWSASSNRGPPQREAVKHEVVKLASTAAGGKAASFGVADFGRRTSSAVLGWPLISAHCRAVQLCSPRSWVLAVASSRACMEHSGRVLFRGRCPGGATASIVSGVRARAPTHAFPAVHSFVQWMNNPHNDRRAGDSELTTEIVKPHDEPRPTDERCQDGAHIAIA